MANEPQKIEGGVFIDTKTDEVVHEKPEEGVQIVPEGGVLDDHARGLLKAIGGESAVGELDTASAAVDVDTAAVSDEVETADDKKTVTTKTVKGK